MRTALYTIADLGRNRNLKSPEAIGVINALDKKKVFCRTYGGKNKDYVPYFKSKLIPQLYTFLGKREYANNTMDSKGKIAAVSQAIFLPYAFPRTLKLCKRKGIKTINFGTSACGETYDKFAKKEHEKFHLEYNTPTAGAFKGLREADYIITYSNWFKNLYTKDGYPEERIFLCPLGVDIKRFKPGVKKDKVFRVTCVADFGIMKGLQYLLESWKSLGTKKDAELVLVGNKPKVILDLIQKYAYPNVKLVKHTDPVPFYQQSSLFVLHSLTEGSSRVMYEAMACGVPVAVTENTGPIIKDRDKTFTIVTKNNGFITKIRDVKSLTSILKWSYTHQNKLKEMGKNARNHIKKFNWKNYTRRIKEILKIIK